VSDDGHAVHDVVAENLRMKAVQAPFFLRVQERDLAEEGGGQATQAGRLYDVTIRNLVVDDCTLPGMILGIPGHPVEGVTLDGVTLVDSVGGTAADRDREPSERNLEYPDAPYFGTQPAFGLFARHVSGPLVLKGTVDFRSSAPAEARAAVVLEDVQGEDLAGLKPGLEVVDRDR
jgi:hypothetical protein